MCDTWEYWLAIAIGLYILGFVTGSIEKDDKNKDKETHPWRK